MDKRVQMCIVTGPRIDLAIGLISRLNMLFTEKALIIFDTKENFQEVIKLHTTLQKLVVSLQTAVVSDEWKLDKQQTSHDNILDPFRLACNYEAPRSWKRFIIILLSCRVGLSNEGAVIQRTSSYKKDVVTFVYF